MEEEDVVERGVDDGDDDERVDKMAVMGGGRKEKRNEMSLPCEIISSSQLRSLSTILLKIIMQIYSSHSHSPRRLSVSAIRSSLQSSFFGNKIDHKDGGIGQEQAIQLQDKVVSRTLSHSLSLLRWLFLEIAE